MIDISDQTRSIESQLKGDERFIHRGHQHSNFLCDALSRVADSICYPQLDSAGGTRSPLLQRLWRSRLHRCSSSKKRAAFTG